MTNDQIIIDASKCEWRTGVEHCGDYECMLNKCCDYNCDWYKRRKLEKQLQAKEQECEYLKKKLVRKEAVVEFASCPSYGYSDNTIEATCTKTFCYDVNSCEHKTMVKYELTLAEIKDIAQKFYYQELGNRDCMNCDDYCFEQILQKIRECEVE